MSKLADFWVAVSSPTAVRTFSDETNDARANRSILCCASLGNLELFQVLCRHHI